VWCVAEGHLEMVKFLLEAGADQEHKTDEMHTALMEASMDGHVEVARLLLDHGAQVIVSICRLSFPPYMLSKLFMLEILDQNICWMFAIASIST